MTKLHKTLSLLALVIMASSFMPKKKIHLYMAGDSTMANKKPERYPETGWGQVLNRYFTDDVAIDNRAMNGRSTKSFINENRWQQLIDKIAEGDYVFIQFGHNDEKTDNEKLGTSLQEYETNLTRFVNDVRQKNAYPILLTPVMRRSIKNGAFYNSHGDYPAVVRKVATAENVPLIDMLERSKTCLENTGIENSKKLFLIADSAVLINFPKGVKDNTHFSEEGAVEMAKLAVDGIKALKLPLAAYLKQNDQ